MTTMPLQTERGFDQFLHDLYHLNDTQLDAVWRRIAVLKVEKQGQSLSSAESTLLTLINRGFPTEQQTHFDELIRKRQAETLSAAEHQQLIEMSDLNEQIQLDRLQALVKLAALRKQSLDEVMGSNLIDNAGGG